MTAAASRSATAPVDPTGAPAEGAVPAATGAVGQAATAPPATTAGKPRELGGPPGPEPTRFGDWERAGRCIDF
jgi:hypothetical protein